VCRHSNLNSLQDIATLGTTLAKLLEMIIQSDPEENKQGASNSQDANKSVRDERPAAAESIRRRDKIYYLDLIKRQSQQMRELGLLRSLGPEQTARIDAELGRLDLDLLKAIARGAENLLRGN
jgi:hypothetical protein